MYSWAKVTCEVLDRLRAGELVAVVVVVQHQVAVQAARQPVRLARLAPVRGRVAEKRAAELREIDVCLALAAALAPVGLRLAPAKLAVLDRVDVLGDPLHALDEVGNAVAVGDAVGVEQLRRVYSLRHPVNAEVGRAGGRVRRFRIA